MPLEEPDHSLHFIVDNNSTTVPTIAFWENRIINEKTT